MQELRVQSLGQEDPLEEETATHSSILAWEIPGTEEPGGQQSMGSQKSWTQLSNNNKLRHIFFPLKHNCRRKEGRGWGGGMWEGRWGPLDRRAPGFGVSTSISSTPCCSHQPGCWLSLSPSPWTGNNITATLYWASRKSPWYLLVNEKMLLPYQWTKGVTAVTLQPPQGNCGWNGMPCHQALQLPPHRVPWGDSGWKSKGYWPQRAAVHVKGMMHLPKHMCMCVC